MYTEYFGLTEAPFSITPDPRYLYMSERHREALAHLLYGIGEGGGFVQLTGEVGTGKTTLCRCLLDQLPPQVDVALILNPRLTGIELLATVCDELGIAYPSETTSLKLLVDALYRHLLDAHARGRRTVLIIDEAQNLATEVLEQIRLLTNLETAREKLLQIILIGQPELIRILDRQELRQLAQRVTARYHLLPFSAEDTRACIRHRMDVAGQKRMLFSDGAMRQVHRFSGGIPRLINVICDRALLGAYAQDHQQVDAATVRGAAAEVHGRAAPPRYARPLLWLSALAVLVAAIAGTWTFLPPGEREQILGRWTRTGTVPSAVPEGMLPTPPRGAQRPAGAALAPQERSAAGTVPTGEPPPVSVTTSGDSGRRENTEVRLNVDGHERDVRTVPAPDAVKLADVLVSPSLDGDKKSAFASLYSRWRLDYDRAQNVLGCERGRAEGLHCLFKIGSWDKLRRFNLPAIIELVTPAGERRYATVTALGTGDVTLAFGRRQLTFELSEVERFWDGNFILLWKPPAVNTLPIEPGMRGKDVEWVRQRLSDIDGTPPGDPRDFYDDKLKERVMAFQRSRSLVVDGIAGEETLNQLTMALNHPGTPVLSSTRP